MMNVLEDIALAWLGLLALIAAAILIMVGSYIFIKFLGFEELLIFGILTFASVFFLKKRGRLWGL